MDPTTYATPDEAVEEFAKEIEPKTLRLDSEIGAGNSSIVACVSHEFISKPSDFHDVALICLVMCAGEFGTVFRGVWKEQPKKQVAVAIKTLKVTTAISRDCTDPLRLLC